MAQGKKLKVWDLTDLKAAGQSSGRRGAGITCDGPGFSETGGSGDGLQRWLRAANDFLGQI